MVIVTNGGGTEKKTVWEEYYEEEEKIVAPSPGHREREFGGIWDQPIKTEPEPKPAPKPRYGGYVTRGDRPTRRERVPSPKPTKPTRFDAREDVKALRILQEERARRAPKPTVTKAEVTSTQRRGVGRWDVSWQPSRKTRLEPTPTTKPTTYTIPAEAYVPKGIKTWTAEQFEKIHGVEVTGLPKGSLIIGYTKREEPVTRPFYREELLEKEYGVDITVPAGMGIISYKETKEGLRLEFYPKTITAFELQYVTPTKVTYPAKPSGPRTGRARDIGVSEFGSLIAPTLISIKTAKAPRLSETLPRGSFEAGVVSAGESLAETFLPYPTPQPGYMDIFQLHKQPPAFIAGRVVGEAAQAVALGWVFQAPLQYGTEKVGKGLAWVGKKTGVTEVYKFSRLAKAVSTVKGKLPSYKGSKLDVWLTKHSKSYYRGTGGIATGEVGQRVLSPKITKVGLGEMKAATGFWEMIQAPRTGGVMLGKAVPTVGKTLQTYTFYWTLKAGKLVPKFGPERAKPYAPISQREPTKSVAQMFKPVKMKPYTPIYQRGLLPFVTQKQVTRMGLVPYTTRKVVGFAGKRAVSPLTTTIVGGATKAMLQELSSDLRKHKQNLRTLELQEVKQREQLVQRPKRKERRRLVPKFWQPTVPSEIEWLRLRRSQIQRLKQKEEKYVTPIVKVARPILAVTPIVKERLKPPSLKQQMADVPKIGYRPEPVTIPKIVHKQVVAPTLKLVITPKLVQKQKQVFIRPPPILEEVSLPPPIPFFPIPRGGEDVSRGVGGLFGKWFKREHKIKTPREVLRAFGMKPTRARRKGRKKRGVKGRRVTRRKGGVLSWF